MNVTEAAKVFRTAKREEEKRRAVLKTAVEVLKDYFRESGKTEFRGVRYAKTTRTQLDTTAVRHELGTRINKFQRDVEVETLSLKK